QREGTDLPNVQVRQVELLPNLDLIAAGTHGRGLWTFDPPLGHLTRIGAARLAAPGPSATSAVDARNLRLAGIVVPSAARAQTQRVASFEFASDRGTSDSPEASSLVHEAALTFLVDGDGAYDLGGS